VGELAERGTARVLVLLADDDEEDRLLLHEAWEASGIPVELRSVASGHELLDYLLHDRPATDGQPARRPDLILLDLEMPRMDGLAVLAELRARGELRRIPVVMLSSCSLSSEVGRCYALGARSYISKPHSFGELVDIVQNLADYWFCTVRLPPGDGGLAAGAR
jgi:CheY-like chemotaxis protein